MKQIISFAVFFTFFSVYAIGQATIIKLANPSFEGDPRASKTPYKWTDCGFPSETPPDIHPGSFGVNLPAYDGITYLGMVTRDIFTFESISQQLSTYLLGGQCYQFSIYINRSEFYLSTSQKTNQAANYIKPIILRVWGGNDHCIKIEQLAVSETNTSSNWEQHTFIFRPTKKHTHLLLEAYYEMPVSIPYNGHILLDNASSIIPLHCDSIINMAAFYEANLSKPYLNLEEGIFQIPSVIDGKILDEVIEKIHSYKSIDSLYMAKIYISNNDRKAAKITKKLIIERLGQKGWINDIDYYIIKGII